MVSRPTQHKGFTLIELMVTIAIAAILLTIGVPSLTSFFDRQKVVAAAEEAYSNFQLAKTEAIARSGKIYIEVSNSTDSWSYGFAENDGCSSSSCKLTVGTGTESVSTYWTNDDHEGVSLVVEKTVGDAFFDGTRGSFDEELKLIFSYGSYSLKIDVSKVGKISLCSPSGSSIGGYSSC